MNVLAFLETAHEYRKIKKVQVDGLDIYEING